MAERLGTALQKLLQRFESASDLKKSALQVIVAHFFVSEDKFTPFFTPRFYGFCRRLYTIKVSNCNSKDNGQS